MLKNRTIVTILNPSVFVTATDHPAFEMLEPSFLAGRSPDEHETAMVVAKTQASGSLYYLLTTPQNEQFIAPENAIEMSAAASKLEYLEWFHDSFNNQVPDASLQFAMATGKNAPVLHQVESDVPTPHEIEEQPGMPVEPEVMQAMEVEQEDWVTEPAQPAE